MAKRDPLLEVRHLVKHFPIKSGILFDREVASVKANKSGDGNGNMRGVGSDRVVATNMPVRPMITFAYQVAGYQWLNYLRDIKWGGILADDMGLGKTIQALSMLATRRWGNRSIVALTRFNLGVFTAFPNRRLNLSPHQPAKSMEAGIGTSPLPLPSNTDQEEQHNQGQRNAEQP